MKKIAALFILFTLGYTISRSQVQNVNPDPNGDPWIVGGLRVPSDEELAKIPVMENIKKGDTKDLPQSLDNSTLAYFRPVFNQTDGSCGQASGVGYLFTYELNRVRGTSANTTSNQFPTHYTYNFLNGGSGSNGSWMTDGWEIIRASGCPTVATYGGIAASDTYWMSGYTNYTSGMGNRVDDMFSINVGTPEGLETLKYWMYDHLDGSTVGGIVNFGAGISNSGYDYSGTKIISWGYPVNHAMTFVGWDDNITYDFSGDGNITNDLDINGDQVVDMKDWERGAMIMVNSWGTGWMNNGKAYVMYKLLADATDNGGIHANKVYGIHVKETQESQLYMKVKMTHNVRNLIRVRAGVSEDVFATSPDTVINFPLFSKQGGPYDMRGAGNTSPIEFAIDITPLLNQIESGANAKFFLLVEEDDPYSEGSGAVADFSIVDVQGNELVSASHNIPIVDNGLTLLSVTGQIEFEVPEITNTFLPSADAGTSYAYQMEGTGGTPPYKWNINIEYNEADISETFPTITSGEMTPTDYDDGWAVQSIEFDFPFYGELFNEFTVCTDGSLLFEEGFEYLRTEEAIQSTKMIGVFASDLMIYPASGDGMYYQGDENSATFRWKTSLFGDESANIDVAVTLYPSGEIKFYYGNGITEGIEWAAGISSGTGSYSILSLSGDYSPSNRQLKLESTPFPHGMHISDNGLFSGPVPNEQNTWDIQFIITDNNRLSSRKTLVFSSMGSDIHEIFSDEIQLSPVPCNGLLTVTYKVEDTSPVCIEVRDISGKLIACPVNELQTAGTYTLTWDPGHLRGLYLIQIQTNAYRVTKKVIFTK